MPPKKKKRGIKRAKDKVKGKGKDSRDSGGKGGTKCYGESGYGKGMSTEPTSFTYES